MEGHNNHTYIQEDINYDDIMNGGWSAATDAQYNYQHPPQDQYTQFAEQSAYDSFNLSPAPSYPSLNYSNSPYASQFQNARPSDVFNQTPYGVDPSLSGSAYHGHDNTFSFAPQVMESATVSPQNLQYSMPPSQNMNRAASTTFQQRPATTVANFNQRPQAATTSHSAMYYMSNGKTQTNQTNAARYPTLPNNSPAHDPKPTIKHSTEEDVPPANRQLQAKATPVKDPLRITHAELLQKHSSSRPPLQYASFIHWEDKPIDVTLGLKNTLPKYHPRKSRSGKDLVPGLDIGGTLPPARVSEKKRGRPPKERKILVSSYKGTSKSSRPLSDKVSQLREDGTIVASPSTSTSTETSSSEDDSSSEEESEYEEDEAMPVLTDISTIRGSERPSSPPEAARWDAIGIVWKDSAASHNAEIVKDAIEKYGNFVTALRMKLKANSTKTEAASAKPAELQALKNERSILLDSLYETIQAANKHGYLPIVENLGGHHKLVNGLTTTLIECVKTSDYTGKLPKAVLTLLAKFQTMTDDLLQKLKFDSIQKRWNKKGDDETKKLIAQITTNTTDAKERDAKSKKEAERVEDERKIKEKMEAVKLRTLPASNTGSSAPSKRPHEGDSTNGKPMKKFASDVGGAPAVSKVAAPKRPLGNLLGIASKPLAKSTPKKREVSPPTESKLGALLASIEKPPEPPKAPAAPPRSPETPEEKARRERKESRRHLRVKFKEGPELEEIRLFKHEQVEDEGRQDEMLRDAHDDRSEGMMHKKRVAETIDDEEEYQPMIADQPYPELVGIDFSSLQKQHHFGTNYVTRGGDLTFTTPEQRTQQRREEVELVAIYTDPSDIPPSAKEPPQFDNSSEAQEQELKLPSNSWFTQRLQLIDQYGLENATQILLAQHARQNQDQGRVSQQFPSFSQQPNQQSSGQIFNQQQQVMAQEIDWAEIARIVSSLKNKPFPPVEPPDWMVNEAQRKIWWDGYNRDNAKKQREEAEQRAAIEMQNTHAYQPPPPVQAPQYQQPMSFPPPLPFPTPTASLTNNPQQVPDVTQQVQEILASYQNGNSKAAAAPQFDYNNWNTSANNSAQNSYNGQEQGAWSGGWNENADPNTASSKSKPRNNTGNDPALFDQFGEYKGKKKPCRFYREGKCVKGDKCTYLHDD